MKKVIITIIILFLISSGFFTYKFIFMRNKDEKKSANDAEIIESKSDSKNMEVKEDEPITEDNKDNNDVTTNDNTNDSRTSSSNMESNSVPSSNVVKENKTTNNNNEEPKQESTQVQQPTPQPEPEQPTHEPTAWESLGISEYDYYHKPMWSWARVDYPTHEACIEAGNQLDDIISFSCTNINSYSGAYLGDMLSVKK